jgi:hypothetical protein
MIFVIVEFHPLNDMIPEPDADVRVRLDVARGRGRAAAHSYPCHGAKPAGQVDFVGCPAFDPGPAEPLAIAEEGQINAIGLGLCRTDAHEPAVVRSSTGGANNERDEGPQKEGRHPPSRNPRERDTGRTREHNLP